MSRFLISILSMRMESGVNACIESVLAAGGDFDLMLTANGNQEVEKYFRSVKSHVTRLTSVTVVSNVQNLGFIAPNNEAFHYANDNGYDLFITLNDDCVVPCGWLEAIDAEFQRHPAAAIVGARGGCRTLGADFHGTSGPTLDYVEGSAAAYRVSVWAKHFKSLYPDWLEFAYGEDASTALEVQRLGYTVHEANFEVQHARGSTSKHVPGVRECQARNHEKAKVRYSHWLRHRTFAHRIIVKRTAAIGDVLLTTPVIAALWRANPLCTIHVETLFPELFAGNLHVTSAAKVIPRQGTDLVIDLDGTYEATPMRHIVRSYAQAADVEIASIKTAYRVRSQDASQVKDQLFDVFGERWVALHAGLSTWHGKNWPIERWVEVMAHLRKIGYATALVGAQTNFLLTRHCDVDLTGKTSIPELHAVMARCAFCVSIDSFPLHAAQAVGTPVVGLFGVTTPEFICTDGSRWVAARSDKFHPDTGLRHRVAGATMVQTDDSVMQTISVDQVLQCIEEISTPKPAQIHA